MDADTHMEVLLSTDQRTVRLDKGRVLFDVARDADRPFKVIHENTLVEAIGTSFSVDSGAADTAVVLFEGKVSVAQLAGEGRSKLVTMQPGTRLTVDAKGRWAQERINEAVASSWTKGKLIFSDAPLAQVVSEVQRYSSVPIRMADDGTKEKRLGAVLKAGAVETFVGAVEVTGAARVTRTKDGGFLLHQ